MIQKNKRCKVLIALLLFIFSNVCANNKLLYLGANILNETNMSYDAAEWTCNGGICHYNGYNKKELLFKVQTEENSTYLFSVTQISGTLVGAFHIQFGEGNEFDPYNLTNEMTFQLSSNGNDSIFKIKPHSGSSFGLSNLKLQKIVPKDLAVDSIIIENSNVVIGNSKTEMPGIWNIAIGTDSTFCSNINATRSIAVGHNALNKLKSGIQNVAIGTFSLFELQHGERNLGVGPDAMYRTKEGYDNIAIGRTALSNEQMSGKDVILERNISIGNQSMSRHTSNTHDAVSIGYMANRDSGNETVSVGNYSGRNGGDRNVTIGFNAGVLNNNSDNVAIGWRAYRGDKAKGKGNVIIGSQSDLEGPEGANKSIVIGYKSKGYGNNSIIIGSEVEGLQDNQTIIGNENTEETIVYGDLIVKCSDNVYRQIVFNSDGSISWVEKGKLNETTKMEIPMNQSKNTTFVHSIYGLDGIAVKRIMKSGFYIIDGKKMYVDLK